MREVAAVFLKFGLIGFGGPAAHIALMRRELVDRRKWVDEKRFLQLFGVSNLIPGPTSTQLALMLGYERGGPAALVVAGLLFIGPAFALVLALAWTYRTYGALPEAQWVLYGVTAAVVGVIGDAIYRMGRSALTGIASLSIAVVVFALYLLGVSVPLLLLGGGLVLVLVDTRGLPGLFALPKTGAVALGAASFSLVTLFLTFLKIGAITYGGGYVLFALLRADFVQHLGWLTDRQLVDAIAVGQFTPGPVFTTATFVGYLVGDIRGAIIATVGIFLPSFVFAAVAYRLLPRLAGSERAQAFLRGATAAALGLMTAVAFQLGRVALTDPFTVVLASTAFVLSRRELNTALIVLGGGIAGVLFKLI